MSVNILSEIMGSRSKWIQMHPGKMPTTVFLSRQADIDLCSHLNQSSNPGMLPTVVESRITTCEGRRIYNMDIVIDSTQKVPVKVGVKSGKTKDRDPHKSG